MTQPLTDKEAERIGVAVVRLLYLKSDKYDGRYDTSGGSKTARGLGRTIERIVTNDPKARASHD